MEQNETVPAGVLTLAEGIRAGKRRALAKAITLVENNRPDRRKAANALVSNLLPHTGKAVRVGISGVPGVGKSTFIEALGLHLTGQGHRVAVLAVDPSSRISGGSIMGDKVRMEALSRDERAFIRPSPSACSLGGVARRTRESMLLCEAAGYDVILIETVGVGQSEVTVSEMTDFFLVLLLPNAGDEIQGIKKGIIEMADGLIINKSEGEMEQAARRAERHYKNAVRLARPKYPGRFPPVGRASALNGDGIDKAWEMVLEHRRFLQENRLLDGLRADQTRQWFHGTVRDDLLDRLYRDPRVQASLEDMYNQMSKMQKSAHQCAEEIVSLFLSSQTP